MKKIILLLFIFISNYAHSQLCKEQVNFLSNFNLQKDNLNIKITRLDNKRFSYYTIPPYQEDIFVGIKMEDERDFDLSFKNLGEGVGGPSFGNENKSDFNYAQQLHNFFKNGNNSLSTYYYYLNVSQIYQVPIKTTKDVNKIDKKINMVYFLDIFNNIFKANNIQGKQRIKMYVKLLHKQGPDMKCSYFESQSFTFDFDKLSKEVKKEDYNEEISTKIEVPLTNTEKIKKILNEWFKI